MSWMDKDGRWHRGGGRPFMGSDGRWHRPGEGGIAAIETEYAGVRFRSRLEARWAFFFDQLGISWEYEPEAFKLSTGRCYLPDFRFPPDNGFGCRWAEVKPEGDAFDLARAFSLDLFGATGGFDHYPESDDESQVLFCEGEPSALIAVFKPRDDQSYSRDSSYYRFSDFDAAAAKARAHRFWEPKSRSPVPAVDVSPMSGDEARAALARLSVDAEAARARREAAEEREHERGAEQLRARLSQLKGKNP